MIPWLIYSILLVLSELLVALLLSDPYGKFEVKATFRWSWHIISVLFIKFALKEILT